MDWLANEIIDVLQTNIGDDYYIESKKESFKGLDRLGAAREISNLDSVNKSILAAKLNVLPSELDIFCKVLARI